MILTTHFGSKLKYLGRSCIPGMVEVETEDLYKTTVLIADLREQELLKSDAMIAKQKVLDDLVG